MKNFSDLLGIDPAIDINIHVSPCCDRGSQTCGVSVNGEMLYQERLSDSQNLFCRVSLMEPIKIEISMQGQLCATHGQTGVRLDRISIDGFDIMPQWTHLISYRNNQLRVDHAGCADHNAVWILDIPEPFYRWRHRISGQGWLLEPISIVHDCIASSANTTAKIDHIVPVDSAGCIDAISARTIGSDSH